MNLVCIVKYVPDVDNFKYDYENNTLIRENVRLLLNPDDACAVAFALRMKLKDPETNIEIVTMAPESVRPHMEDLLRLGVDKGTILSDRVFAGSDTYVTSKVLASYLGQLSIDCLLSGTHAIDGDTSHIPAQVAEVLGVNQMSGIIRIDEEAFDADKAVFDVETEEAVTTYEMSLPGVLSVSRESNYKLPYPKRADIGKDVSDRIQVITNENLGFAPGDVGLKGSPTKVTATYTKEFNNKGGLVVGIDDEGIDTVYDYIKEKGYLT